MPATAFVCGNTVHTNENSILHKCVILVNNRTPTWSRYRYILPVAAVLLAVRVPTFKPVVLHLGHQTDDQLKVFQARPNILFLFANPIFNKTGNARINV